MKNNSLVTDVSYLLLLAELCICAGFLVFYAEDKSIHFLIFILVLAILAVSRLTVAAAGLILNVLFLFGYLTLMLYQWAGNGQGTAAGGNTQLFFWVVLSPVLTVTGEMVILPAQKLKKENGQLLEQVERAVYEDALTGLKNNRALETEVPVYQKLALRYGTGLTFVICRFRFERELIQIMGRDRVNKAAVQIAAALEETFRREDAVYVISADPWCFGLLMMTREGSGEKIVSRLKAVFPEITVDGMQEPYQPKIEMRIGIYQTISGEETAEELMKHAETSMQYDV